MSLGQATSFLTEGGDVSELMTRNPPVIRAILGG